MSENTNSYKNVHIVCFSGTGGARRVAEAFARNLSGRGIEAALTALDRPGAGLEARAKPDLLLLVYAVHAFDAPEPVHRWLENASLEGVRAAVVSVSGGGEHWPNSCCRGAVCKAFARRGAKVVYENMMVMPCNWVVPVRDEEAMYLLSAVPEKVEKMLDAMLAGRERRTRARMRFAVAWITKLERFGARRFPKGIRTGESCNGCGWCARNCPSGNIAIQDGKPTFSASCAMCFRCVYGCPSKALKTKNFMVLKQGFDLDALEKRMKDTPLPPIEECFKGRMWKAVREYLTEG